MWTRLAHLGAAEVDGVQSTRADRGELCGSCPVEGSRKEPADRGFTVHWELCGYLCGRTISRRNEARLGRGIARCDPNSDLQRLYVKMFFANC